MAEILAIAAGGLNILQLAGEVASSIKKLKCYWKRVKEAPKKIQLLVEELDSLNLVLCHMQSDQTNEITSDSECESTVNILSKSLVLCQKGANELSTLVEHLATSIDGKGRWKEKVGCTKVALKSAELKEIKERMQHAIWLLGLAYQCHTKQVILIAIDEPG